MRDQSIKTLGLPRRLGTGVLAATSVYPGVFTAPVVVGSGATGNGVIAHAPVVSTAGSVAPDGGSSTSVDGSGYMVTSARARAA